MRAIFAQTMSWLHWTAAGCFFRLIVSKNISKLLLISLESRDLHIFVSCREALKKQSEKQLKVKRSFLSFAAQPQMC
jgi:hypothetical protein